VEISLLSTSLFVENYKAYSYSRVNIT